jgi:hypothetical protein
MYAASIVDERLAIAAQTLGWKPEYHSTDEVDKFTEYLKQWEKYNASGQLYFSRDLKQNEYRFIVNEKVLCTCDAAYYLTRYAHLSDENDTNVRYKFRDTQKIYFHVISELEAKHAAIEIIIGKGRQQFVTTIIELLIGHRVFFHKDTNALTASADRIKSEEMGKKILFAYDNLQWWLKPKSSRRVESVPGLLEFESLNSRVSIQHGATSAKQKGQQRVGLGRGGTRTVWHVCLSGRCLVRTTDSRLVPIKEILVGDQTISQDGSLVKINRVWKSPRANELTSEIFVWGMCTPITSTRDHKILTNVGWKEARTVTTDDRIMYPVRPIYASQDSVVWEWYEKHKQIKSGRTETPLSYEFGRLVGLYLAEGSIDLSRKVSRRLTYSLHQDELATVQSWISDVFEHVDPHLGRRRSSKTGTVYIYERGFVKWIQDNFGFKDSKRIPDCVWNFGPEFCKGLVYGYLFGDGHFAKDRIFATSIRLPILIGIRELLISLGIGWSQITYREPGFWYGRNCAECWTLEISGSAAKLLLSEYGEEFSESLGSGIEHWQWNERRTAVEVQVKQNGDGFSEDFYDLEVDHDSHSFLSACGIVHNSEAAHIPRPEEQIEASLMRATHASPKVFGNIESSFSGKTGWFADKYRYAKEHRNDGLSRLTPIFFSWPCAHDIYPTRTWISTHPVPFEWKPKDKVLSQIIKAELFIRNDPLLGDYFGTDWIMPIDQQWFYHCLYTEALGSGNMSSLQQEVACDDVEAMIASYDNVFGQETIEVCHQNRVQKYDVYGITGQSIEDKHEPKLEDIDTSKPRIPIVHTSNQGDTYKWELVPLKYELYENPSGKREELEYINDVLFVFKQPSFRQPFEINNIASRAYGVGVDTGTGQGHDYSAICVTERGDGPIADIQVAEWRSNTVGHVEAFAYVMPICLYFTNPNKEINNYPLVGIEQLTAVGDVCQKEMKRLGYPAGRFFNFGRYDSRNALKQLTNKQGWFTTGWSRPILVGNFIYVVQNQWYILNSPWTIEECREFEVHKTASGKTKEEHSSESNDDCIFAAGISTFIMHDMDTLADRSKKQSRVGEALPKLVLGPYAGQVVNTTQGGIREATLDEILELSY